MSDYPYKFDAKIDENFVHLPKAISARIDFSDSKRVRIDAEIACIRSEASLLPTRGKGCWMVSMKLQKLIDVAVGDQVSIAFEVANQDAITVPMELQYAFEANRAAREGWESWTAGERRGFCDRVGSTKIVETRQRRIDEVIKTLIEYTR